MRERFARALGLGAERLEEVPALVRPAADLDDRAVGIEMVVDDVRVGDEIALVAREQPVDAGAVVAGRVAEEHVPRGRHQDPEVAEAAFLFGLHEHARRVGAEHGLRRTRPLRIASTSGRASAASSACQPQSVERASARPSRA